MKVKNKASQNLPSTFFNFEGIIIVIIMQALAQFMQYMFFAAFWSAFPDLSHKIEDMVAEGEDKVAVHIISTGTHKGEFQGIPPTGKEVSFAGMGFLTIRDGKIVEQRKINDTMGLMQQIGAIPSAPTSGSSTASS